MSDDDVRCTCGYGGDWYRCINANVYGPCDLPDCGGVCEQVGRCTCSCHD